ncbi:hypothetical protein FJZ36_18075 [Candidatus Poribacteria bacterium]|nr:hypothetical protein [Candidatus Poribacteria bacterium]
MERRYPVLRLSVKVLRVLAWIAVAVAAIFAVVGAVGPSMGGIERLIVIGAAILYGALIFGLLMIYAELLRVAVDIEENTRGTRSAVEALRAERAESPASGA